MGAGVEVYAEKMKAVETDIRARYDNVERVTVHDIDVSMFGRTNAAGVVAFTDGKPSMGFDVEVRQEGFSSLSHEGRQENKVVLWERK